VNYEFIGDMPNFSDFCLFVDSKMQIEKKKNFVDEQKKQGGNWNLKKELLQSVTQEAKVVLKACLSFVLSCFSFQESIHKMLNLNDQKFIHPFDSNISTISGYTFKVCSYYFLKEYPLHGVNFEYTGNSINSSRGELEFATFKEFNEPENEWVHLYNSPEGQKAFKNIKVDLWSPKTKTVYQYYEYAFHYHLPPDYKINIAKTNDYKKKKNIPFSNLKINDDRIKDQLLEKFSDEISSHNVIYECQWNDEKRENIDYLIFQKEYEHYIKRPTHRLVPRTCVRSGLSDVYYLRWEKDLFPDERFIYADVQGLYSQAAIEYEYPIGKYDIFVGIHLSSKITFKGDGFHYYEDKKLICGAAFVKIEAPKNLKTPFLQFRIQDQFNFLALCQECCITKSKVCLHTTKNTFESVWMLSDIRKAVSLGYKILEWYEIHFFPNTAPILRSYTQILYSEKIKNSGFPESVKTIDQKLEYCEHINFKLSLPEQFMLTPQNVEKNNALRQLAKSQLNNLYGKFSQNSNKVETTFVNNQFQLEEILKTKKIADLFNVVENILQVEVEKVESNPKPKTNIYIGAQIR